MRIRSLAFRLALTVPLAAASAACGSDGSDGEGSDGPVSSSPLAGTIDGKPFTARSALLRAGFSGDSERMLSIYDVDATCGKGVTSDREILTSIPWTTGYADDLGFNGKPTVTFVVGAANNHVATVGRIEVVDATTDGTTLGTVRLRATMKEHKVEGEVKVQVCN
jgi:hypothetical protein